MTSAPAAIALALVAAFAAGTACADEPCLQAGPPDQAETISRRLASADGVGTAALGAFVARGTIYVLLPRGPTVVIPPDVSGLYRGQVPADAATILMFAAEPARAASGSGRSFWRIDREGLVVVPRAAVAGVVSFGHRGQSYVFLAGGGRQAAPACLAPGLTMLPSTGGIAFLTEAAPKIIHSGSEAVIEAGSMKALVSPCCTEEPQARGLDPRHLLDESAYTRHVESERFFGPHTWRDDWTSAALDAHARLRAGDLDEARAALGDVRRRLGDAASPAIVLLHDLLHLDRIASGSAPAAEPAATVREDRARLRTAHVTVAACRSRDFTLLRRQRLAFVEVFPPPELLAPPLAARLALCEAEYLLDIGETRAALARLRSPDAPAEGAGAVHRLILDIVALRRAGQGELAAFAAGRLHDMLDDPAGPPDLRASASYLSADHELDPRLVLRLILDRQQTFGDYRLDFRLVAAATTTVQPAEIVPHLDALRRFAARAPDPALSLAIIRLVARRLTGALASADPGAAAAPLAVLDFVRHAASRAELTDLRSDLVLARAELSLHAGLDEDARAALLDILESWPAGERLDETRKAWLDRLLRRYATLLQAQPAARFDDPLWLLRPANESVAALLVRARHDMERDAVARAVLDRNAWEALPQGERRLFERLRKLRLEP
jgi:hypothetical protein